MGMSVSAVAQKGVMTRRAPTPVEWNDLTLGFKVAKSVGRMDVGQTVVVKNGIVLAVEALEGTDEAVRREMLRLQIEALRTQNHFAALIAEDIIRRYTGGQRGK